MINHELRLSYMMLIATITALLIFGFLILNNHNLKKLFSNAEKVNNKIYSYQLNNIVDVKIKDSDRFLGNGWSLPEVNHRWTDGKNVEILLKNKDFINHNLVFKIQMSGLVVKDIPYQNVKVYVNNHFIKNWKVSDFKWYIIKIPAKILKNDVLTIRFVVKTAVSPKKLGASDDTRLLGLYVNKFVLEDTKINGL